MSTGGSTGGTVAVLTELGGRGGAGGVQLPIHQATSGFYLRVKNAIIEYAAVFSRRFSFVPLFFCNICRSNIFRVGKGLEYSPTMISDFYFFSKHSPNVCQMPMLPQGGSQFVNGSTP